MKIVIDDNRYAEGALKRIEAACDAARLRVVGDPVRVWEYDTARQQAQAYRDAGYTGQAPEFVKAWQDAKHRQGWTGRQAADSILATAAPWETALAAIRRLRLGIKEDVAAATSKAQIDAALDQFTAQLAIMMEGVQ